MPDQPPPRPGELQLRILRVLWDGGPASVAEVHEALRPDRDLAYTTVATMLRKMEQRGLVRHRTEARRFIYEPAVAEDTVTGRLADDVLDRVFEGSLSGLVQHLLERREFSDQELDELERLVRENRREP